MILCIEKRSESFWYDSSFVENRDPIESMEYKTEKFQQNKQIEK